MLAADYLGRAQALMIERGKDYDKPEGERSMGRAVKAFNAITGHHLSEAEGWLLMQVLKDVRQWQNPGRFHQDSAEDCIAYSALKAEALHSMKSFPHDSLQDHIQRQEQAKCLNAKRPMSS